MNRYIIIWGIILLHFSSCWWEEPREALPEDIFTSKCDVIMSPDTSLISVGDTIWFSFEAKEIFIAPTGKSKIVTDANSNMRIWLKRKSSGLWKQASVFECSYIPKWGSFSLFDGTNSIDLITPVYSNRSYSFKIGFRPNLADTFYIEIGSSIDQRNGQAYSIRPNFGYTKQNIELLLPDLDGYANYPSKQPYIYAFVAR